MFNYEEDCDEFNFVFLSRWLERVRDGCGFTEGFVGIRNVLCKGEGCGIDEVVND